MVKYIDAKKIEKRSPDKAMSICMSGAKVRDVSSKITELNQQFNIKKIIIHVGGNNIPQDDPSKLSHKITHLLQNCQTLMPLTKIHYSAIIPRVSDSFINGINAVNENVEHFCSENHISFIQHFQFFTKDHGMNFKMFIADKVHPTREGSSVIAKNFIASYRNYRKSSS